MLAFDHFERASLLAIALAEASLIAVLVRLAYRAHGAMHPTLLALTRAVRGLAVTPEHVLIDARKLPLVKLPQTPIIHGDALSLTIAAASILAKTARDALMAELDREHPGYGFAKHKGYPTAEHLAALRAHGPSPIHRRSFAPVRALLKTAG